MRAGHAVNIEAWKTFDDAVTSFLSWVFDATLNDSLIP
jgi:hypothetical protein